jgi:hypothetical protein
MQNWLVAAGVAAALSFGLDHGLAQDNGGGPGGPPGGGFGGGRRNFDPAQFQQMMMDRVKEGLEVTSDDEWKALQPLVQKVMDARMQGMGPGMGRMFGPRRGGGDNGGPGGGRGPFGGPPSPEAESLQRAIDGKASKTELKAAMTKFVESRKAKEAQLKAAQEDLRKVLTTRQEAIATYYGLL